MSKELPQVVAEAIETLSDMLTRLKTAKLDGANVDSIAKVSNALSRVVAEELKMRRAEHLLASKLKPEEKDEVYLSWALTRPKSVQDYIIKTLTEHLYGN